MSMEPDGAAAGASAAGQLIRIASAQARPSASSRPNSP
jgi:hypothetical protein